MAAVLTPAQQEYVSAEITRPLAMFHDAMTATFTASLQCAVDDSKALVTRHFVIEKTEFSLASEALEARIMSTIGATIDERSAVLSGQITAAFIFENAEMRASVDGMKTVMEAISGDQFEEMARKMADLDKLQSQNVAMLGTMFSSASNELRDKALAQDGAMDTLFRRLNEVDQKLLMAASSGAGSAQDRGFQSKLRIPDPSGWKFDVLKGRDDGVNLAPELRPLGGQHLGWT